MLVSSGFAIEVSHIVDGDEVCGRLHGHSWIVHVRLYGPYTIDQLIALLVPVREAFNYQHLNFLIRIPTPVNLATHVARVIWDMLYSDEKVNRLEVWVYY